MGTNDYGHRWHQSGYGLGFPPKGHEHTNQIAKLYSNDYPANNNQDSQKQFFLRRGKDMNWIKKAQEMNCQIKKLRAYPTGWARQGLNRPAETYICVA